MNQKVLDRNIKDGYELAFKITKKDATAFYFASRFLPRDKRCAAFCVYSVCRASDDAVDINAGILKEQNLNELKERISSVYENRDLGQNLLLAFRETEENYKIPQRYFDELFEGMRMDLFKNRYASFGELYDYSYKVAGVIGLIMLKIFGCDNPEAQRHAVDLGIAMQLTNILRDIKEDFARGRIYLPKDEMEKYAISERDIEGERVDDNFKALLQFQIKRARDYYNNSKAGIKMIKGLRSRFVVCAMKDIYAGILDAIEKNGYDVFSKRARVTGVGKFGVALKILMKGEYL